eukprot:2194948-Rhodomonas_salina.4
MPFLVPKWVLLLPTPRILRRVRYRHGYAPTLYAFFCAVSGTGIDYAATCTEVGYSATSTDTGDAGTSKHFDKVATGHYAQVEPATDGR